MRIKLDAYTEGRVCRSLLYTKINDILIDTAAVCQEVVGMQSRITQEYKEKFHEVKDYAFHLSLDEFDFVVVMSINPISDKLKTVSMWLGKIIHNDYLAFDGVYDQRVIDHRHYDGVNFYTGRRKAEKNKLGVQFIRRREEGEEPFRNMGSTEKTQRLELAASLFRQDVNAFVRAQCLGVSDENRNYVYKPQLLTEEE